jgi:excisionase family DNA binding protein
MQQAQLPFDGSSTPSRLNRDVRRASPPTPPPTADVAPAPSRQSEREWESSGQHSVHAPMLLTVRDVEVELQLGRTRTYELLRSGEIPVIRVGRVLRVSRDALRRWIENQTS